MKSMFKSFSMLAIAACAGMSFVACSNQEDYYDPQKAEEFVKASYENNFVRQFGQVRADKNWDMSSFSNMKSTRAEGDEITITHVAGIDFGTPTTKYQEFGNTKGNYAYPTKNVALFDNFCSTLPDNNTHTGEAAMLVAPANSFTIYPLDAVGGYTYDMYIKVGDTDEVCVFNKNWSGYPQHFANGFPTGTAGKNVNMTGVTVNAPIGTPIQIYLKNIKDGNNLTAHQNLGTQTGSAIILDCNLRPEGLSKDIMPEDAIIKYIGFEDQWDAANNCAGGDHDFNDLVIMIIGNPFTPERVIVEDGFYNKKWTVQKRYMMEDLGETDDFDFNDVVVDVKDVATQKIAFRKVNGIITDEHPEGPETHEQSAIIRCLGGTIDFDLTIGNTTWNKKAHKDPFIMWNTGTPLKEPDATGHTVYDGTSIDWNTTEYQTAVSGWNPTTNNVSVRVRNHGSNGVETGTETMIEFPQHGEIPMMIAVDVTKKWMVERIRIPLPWAE